MICFVMFNCALYVWMITIAIRSFVKRKQFVKKKVCKANKFERKFVKEFLIISLSGFPTVILANYLQIDYWFFIGICIFFSCNTLYTAVRATRIINYKLVIRNDKYIFYDFFGRKNIIPFDSIKADESFYSWISPTVAVLVTTKKTYKIKFGPWWESWHFIEQLDKMGVKNMTGEKRKK